jgi:DNA-binding response OmpR family regulator
MNKILILEDDLFLLKTLKEVLIKAHYQVDLTQDLIRAQQLLVENDYDLLIFDRLIKNKDSLEFLQDLRKDQKFLRTLIISQKKLLVDRLISLKAADDFLAKPFATKELLLKVNNLLIRSKVMREQRFVCSYFILNEAGFVCDKHLKNCVYLPKKERKIMECLILHQNQAVSYQTLINYVWPRNDFIPQQRTLNVYVRRIRLKLPAYSQFIKTIRDFGFILDCNEGGSRS